MDFIVNDRVVCVDDSPARAHNDIRGQRLLHIGLVYCVTECFQTAGGSWAINLAGVPCGHLPDGTRCGWDPGRFRLLSDVGHPKIKYAKKET